MNVQKTLRAAVLVTAIGLLATAANAQKVRTAYFFHDAAVSNNLNPAFVPERGYVLLPNASISYLSNGAGYGKFFFDTGEGGKTVSFMDESVDTRSFLDGLPNKSRANVDVFANIFTVGTHIGKGFGTIGVSAKINMGTQAPKSLFEFMKMDEYNSNDYQIKDFSLNAESYVEVAAGYARPINEKLTVGGKIKLLAGIFNAQMDIEDFSAREVAQDVWSIRAKGSIKGSMKGFKFDKNANGTISGMDFDFGSASIGGMGLGVDLGAAYKLTDKIILSASVLDLGFIKWNADATSTAKANLDMPNRDFSGFDTDKIEDALNEMIDLMDFTEESNKSRTTSLKATLNLGGEYRFNKLVSVGLLSSTYFYQPKTITELTLSGMITPVDWFSFAASFSFLQSNFSTIGLAANFHAPGVNFFVGSDYLFFKRSFTNSANVYFGLAIALGKSSN